MESEARQQVFVERLVDNVSGGDELAAILFTHVVPGGDLQAAPHVLFVEFAAGLLFPFRLAHDVGCQLGFDELVVRHVVVE